MSTLPTTAQPANVPEQNVSLVASAALACAAGYVPPEWTGRSYGAGHDLQLGLFCISTTDQTYRGCGWCWHVTAEHAYGNDALAQNGDCATEAEAKAAGIAWVRRHCEETLAALKAVS
jgi:hypothetical protein